MRPTGPWLAEALAFDSVAGRFSGVIFSGAVAIGAALSTDAADMLKPPLACPPRSRKPAARYLANDRVIDSRLSSAPPEAHGDVRPFKVATMRSRKWLSTTQPF
jgi:hypothetical protein